MAYRRKKYSGSRNSSRRGQRNYDPAADKVLYSVEVPNPTAYRETQHIIEISVRSYDGSQPKLCFMYVPYPGDEERGGRREKIGRMTADEIVAIQRHMKVALEAMSEEVERELIDEIYAGRVGPEPDEDDEEEEKSDPKTERTKKLKRKWAALA